MTIKEAIAQRILQLCDENGITLNKLSTTAGITQSTLNDVVHGKSNNPTIKTIYLISSALGIELKDFFDSEIFQDLIFND